MGNSFCLINNFSFIDEDNRIPSLTDGNLEIGIGSNFNVHTVGGSFVFHRPFMALPFSTDDLHLHPFLLENGNLLPCKLLILRLFHFLACPQIQPKLKPNRILFERTGHFWVDYSSPSSHPLHIPRSNYSLMTFEILMMKFPWLHVSDCLKSSMGVVRKTSRKFNFEKIEHEERVEIL